ncbi:MAG: hypothetical protein AAFR16_06745 [Pseudomonadota bacterium]
MSDGRREREPEEQEAQAALDRLRHQAGGVLTGPEVARRHGIDPKESVGDAPPLDWRMTPRNILLQLAAIAAFVGVMGFLVFLMVDGWLVVFDDLSGRGGG